MFNFKVATLVTLFVFGLCNKSHAVEILSAEELASHCVAYPDDALSVDGEYCVRYIQGFIDGAVATDVRVMINIEAESNRAETIAERAMRTRLSSRSERDRAAQYAEFCLGDPIPLSEVVGKVVADLNVKVANIPTGLAARDVIYESLRTHYPCESRR